MNKTAILTGSLILAVSLNATAGVALAKEAAAKEASSLGGVTLLSSELPAGTLPKSVQNEVHAAIDRGLNYLASHQKADGSWSNGDFPALTAFALRAFVHGDHPRKKEILAKGKKFILTYVQKDGGIYKKIEGRKGGGLSNYNTAICMLTLHEMKDPSLTRVILDARKFIAGTQHLGDDMYKGGFGYDKATQRAYTDGLNTFYTVEAMARTAEIEELRPKGEQRVDINWAETVKYISKLQNTEATGGDHAGGFIYKPGESKAGTETGADGKVIFRSYGSMTYVGLLSLIYANVDRKDVRVRSAFDWSAKHWSLEENPGMGQQGMFFFFHVLTKSLHAYGADTIPRKGAKDVNWRPQLAEKLVGKQKTNPDGTGYWTNETARFWESDPILVTAYALISLEML